VNGIAHQKGDYPSYYSYQIGHDDPINPKDDFQQNYPEI
jgi:hypothetical protein